MTYVDGFVIAVPTANRQKFIDHALSADGIFIEMGALRVLECWGDDVPVGKQTDFRRAVNAKDDETVVFSWIEWPDKATRDAAMARMQDPSNTDPRMDPEINPMPFDGARMIFGGFSPVVVVEAPTTNKPGDFLWYELLTTDAEAAQAFYGQILPWTFADSGQADMDYRIASAPEHDVAGLMAINAEMAEHGAKPTWLVYIAVADVDQAVSDIQARGGAVQMPAMDIPMVGRMAMVADPQGAPLYVMKGSDPRKSVAFADDRPRVGHAAWNELHTADPAGAWAFYGETFGWVKDGAMDMGPLGQYQFIRHGGMIGAMMATTEGEPSGWSVYFRVADIDVARQAVEAAGGQVVQGPDQIPGGEYSMNCIDPQGAAFGLVGVRKG
ncbi:DUF1428 family protein [Phenylobacterium sp.]|uniref:DUF1428 family protein n=1 Tax=Phenylobacterium sp. TaxID=1871053 RepID=UPI003FA73202